MVKFEIHLFSSGVNFDLSPKAEPDQMERPGRAFDLAVLPVLSDPEPLEQCSNGSAP